MTQKWNYGMSKKNPSLELFGNNNNIQYLYSAL